MYKISGRSNVIKPKSPTSETISTNNSITDNSETFKGGVEESNITPLENSEKINNNEEKGVDNERRIDRRTNQRTNRENSKKLSTTLQMDKTMVSEQSKRLDTNNQGTIRPNRSERTTDNVTIGNERLTKESKISSSDKELIEKEYKNQHELNYFIKYTKLFKEADASDFGKAFGKEFINEERNDIRGIQETGRQLSSIDGEWNNGTNARGSVRQRREYSNEDYSIEQPEYRTEPTRQEINKVTTLSNSDSAVQQVAKNEVRKWYGGIEKDRYDVSK